MKLFGKKFLMFVATVLLIVSFVHPVSANVNRSLNIQGTTAFLMEMNTGKILYEYNADESVPIASMTKMMSAYLVEEAIANGQISWDTMVTVSNYAHRISQNPALSNVPLLEGEQYTVRELFESAAIFSANGSTIALAEHIAGTEQRFVDMMNERGRELGMQNFEFVNSTGLNNDSLLGMHPEDTAADAENKASARDMAILGYRLATDFPETLDISSIPNAVFREGIAGEETAMPNWNWMLPGLVFEYEGTQGLKTGSTSAAGSCFTGIAERNGVRLLSVVTGTADHSARFVETIRLFDFGFNNFEIQEVLPAGTVDENQPTVKVPNGRDTEVEVATSAGLTTVVERGRAEDVTFNFDMTKTELEAPAEEGTEVGTVTVSGGTTDEFGYLFPGQGEVAVVTTAEVEKANFLVRGFRFIGTFFSDLVDSIF